jgi:hypothetical protein
MTGRVCMSSAARKGCPQVSLVALAEDSARLPSGTELSGVTVLTVNADWQISRIKIHHRPLDAGLEFSREMGKRTAGLIAPGHFYGT